MTTLVLAFFMVAAPAPDAKQAGQAKPAADCLVIKTERVVTVTAGVIENGMILVKQGKIVKIAPRLDIPANAKVVDAEKLTAYPGMVLAQTSIGLGARLTSSSETSTVESGIWPYEAAFDGVLRNGFTAMGLVSSSSGLLGPQGLVIRPLKRDKKEIILGNSNFLRMNFRASYKQSLASSLAKKGNNPLSAAAAGQMTIMINSGDANSTLHLLDVVMPQRAMKKSILQQGDVTNALPNLLRAKMPCIFRTRHYARPNTVFEENPAAIIAQAKIPVCLLPRRDYEPAFESFRFDVALLIRSGLPREAALKAVTIIPAALLGIDWRIGSLEKGKDADVLLLDGDLFDWQTRIQKIFIAGEEVFSIQDIPREENP